MSSSRKVEIVWTKSDHHEMSNDGLSSIRYNTSLRSIYRRRPPARRPKVKFFVAFDLSPIKSKVADRLRRTRIAKEIVIMVGIGLGVSLLTLGYLGLLS